MRAAVHRQHVVVARQQQRAGRQLVQRVVRAQRGVERVGVVDEAGRRLREREGAGGVAGVDVEHGGQSSELAGRPSGAQGLLQQSLDESGRAPGAAWPSPGAGICDSATT